MTKKIPRTGEVFPAIGLGSFLTFDVLPGQPRDHIREVIRRFWEGGGRVIDTSPLYGMAEVNVGDFATALGINDQIFIGNKIWSTGEYLADDSHAARSLEQSRQRLWREKIDLMQCHSLVNAAEIDPSRVVVHKTSLGGGFGRRGSAQDYVRQAVRIAQAVGRPVKLLWSREEDMAHDFYRPVAMARFAAGLDARGRPVAWHTRVAGQSIAATLFPERLGGGTDLSFLEGLHDLPYQVPNLLVDYAMRNTHLPVGFWGSVNHSQNGFFRECFVGEMAHAAGADPYEYRRMLLAPDSKDRAVLEPAATHAGWGSPLPAGVFRGIAVMDSYGSYAAQVAEISISAPGELRVRRIVCAIDPGHVVDPDTIRAQVEGAIVYGLTAALYGRVAQGNFDTYRMLRMHEMPTVEVVLVPSGGLWGGVGEPGLPPLAPALCNAIFAATGKRVRALPLTHYDWRSA